MALYDAKDIKNVKISRRCTGMSDLDWLYGYSSENDQSGLPGKHISLWSAEAGTGKTRLAMEVARKMAREGLRVAYYQKEFGLEIFKTKLKEDGTEVPVTLKCGNTDSCADIIKECKIFKPHLIVIDSVNMLDEFRSGTDKDIKYIDNMLRGYLNVYGGHMIFLSQLNKAGKTRGSSTLPHLIDMEIKLHKDRSVKGRFSLTMGKNRAGVSDNVIYFKHFKEKVKPDSYNRWTDLDYCKMLKRPEMYRDLELERVQEQNLVDLKNSLTSKNKEMIADMKQHGRDKIDVTKQLMVHNATAYRPGVIEHLGAAVFGWKMAGK